ncbi:hypothetical protein Mhun_1527 [Methanospirillum hungatei JF-1]|uniref:Uncharacterized protein n=1 Tax=Methanospirillum hungatei JF-1 (strain ATCC 27890 / DSM 864 / NBRC 100397 / JF-1) TaxID=323259 RepID=Q2FP34_METHJ|nr:hypothetical protein Mhun_1527 [Methanospirillum hungatei JF-1]
MIKANIISLILTMQEKRPNKVLGYRNDIHGEPTQTLIGSDDNERSIIFCLKSGDSTIITSRDLNISNNPFTPCDESVHQKIFRNMKKHPDIYVKFFTLLNEKIPR